MLDLLTNLGIVAGGIIALGVIWSKFLKPLYKFGRRVEDIHDYILVELPAWQKKVDVGLTQLYPNHGTSIHDKVMGTNKTLEDVQRMLLEHLNDGSVHSQPTHVDVTVNT